MRRIVLAVIVGLALMACDSPESDLADPPAAERDQDSSTSAPEPTTSADETTTTTEPEPDWLALARESVIGSGVEVEEVTVRSGVMRIHTDLGYAPDDEQRRGMAAQVCFDVQAATEWDGHIEVHAGRMGLLAWTGASNQGCRGFT